MFGILASIIIAFVSLFVPGILLAFVLLRKTELHNFEVVVVGIIFGLIAPATMTWLEAYLANYIHFFSYSLALFELNALILTIIGLAFAIKDGMIGDLISYLGRTFGTLSQPGLGTSKASVSVRTELSKYARGSEVIAKHDQEDHYLRAKQAEELANPALNQEEREMMQYRHNGEMNSIAKSHLHEERSLLEELRGPRLKESKTHWIVWAILLVLMLVTFYTRMQSIVTAPKFFEFDPYFDMIDAHYILTYGHQLLLDPSAWPIIKGGTNHRIEPIVPYLEAYWYSLVNTIKYHYQTFNINLMSYIGGIYPPITAALLVFIIFMLLYHEYDEKIGLIGAGLTVMMPALLSTFVAGEQLVEPWGIMALFFFIAAYMLAVRNEKDKRLAIFAGLAFVSSFLGAHYYTVTTGVLAIYIMVQGIIEVARGKNLKDFYIMNVIVIAIIAIFLAVFLPYQSTLQNRIPNLLGIPFTVAAPLFALILVFLLQQIVDRGMHAFKSTLGANNRIPIAIVGLVTIAGLAAGIVYMSSSAFSSVLILIALPVIIALVVLVLLVSSRRLIVNEALWWRLALMFLLVVVFALVAIVVPPIRHSLNAYVNLSARFTTASKPLFMTVQEYIPTGLFYNFGAAGFGPIGANLFGVPILVWIVTEVALILLILSIAIRGERTAVLYFAVAAPLIVAGFLEVKYLPHFGTAYIMLFCIIIGELLYFVQASYKLLDMRKFNRINPSVYSTGGLVATLLIFLGLFMLFGMIACIVLVGYVLYDYSQRGKFNQNATKLIGIAVVFGIIAIFSTSFVFGENGAIVQSFKAAYTYATNPSGACTAFNNNENQIGVNLYCNTIPQYWLNAMSWISGNVGPAGPRVLAWWDYGDWINWFGRSNAVLRGDNAEAQEDYAVAAQYVLGPKFNSTPQSLENYMNGNQSKYILFDQDLISKWGALNFLGCINVNATSEQYAISQGAAQSPPTPYQLGTSQCELTHDPEYALIPLDALVQTNSSTQQSISDYCTLQSSNNTVFIRGFLVTGNNLSNATICVDSTPNALGVLQLYNSSGQKMNAVIQVSEYLGVQDIQNVPYVEFLTIYLPNGPNGTITDAPSQFYTSNYYRGFFTGDLPGFKQVYPTNISTSGTNFVNFTEPIRIYEVVNYTGGNVGVPPKPAWITNNDTMP